MKSLIIDVKRSLFVILIDIGQRHDNLCPFNGPIKSLFELGSDYFDDFRLKCHAKNRRRNFALTQEDKIELWMIRLKARPRSSFFPGSESFEHLASHASYVVIQLETALIRPRPQSLFLDRRRKNLNVKSRMFLCRKTFTEKFKLPPLQDREYCLLLVEHMYLPARRGNWVCFKQASA
jgi:hypothetical protein